MVAATVCSQFKKKKKRKCFILNSLKMFFVRKRKKKTKVIKMILLSCGLSFFLMSLIIMNSDKSQFILTKQRVQKLKYSSLLL